MEGMKMAMPLRMLAFTTVAAMFIEATMAVNYTVGAPDGGWDQQTDLNMWASTHKFYPGDIIVFSYLTSHTVLEVSEADYNSCDERNPIASYASGFTRFTLASPGNRYFICGKPGYCAGILNLPGMKVKIFTIRASTPAPKTPSPPPGTHSDRPPPPPPSTSDSSSSSKSTTVVISIGIATAGVVVLVALSLLFVFFRKKGRRKRDRSQNHNPSPPPLGHSQITFTYKELATATNGFSDANLLGQGGFGYVHKGALPNKQEVAVKQLKTGSEQGEREFLAEVEIISRLHHKHLVSLVGYCMTGSERLLVYEFVPNNTMEFHLHGKGRSVMDWPTRLKIALGSAKGLAYLHEDCHPKIIHRDIKAANILVDLEFEAKVADFGLAKFFSDVNTHVSTGVRGTVGYLAPEYASSGKLTEKSDVFSFGIVLLELITGGRPVDRNKAYMDHDSLVDWARPLLTHALEEGNFSTLVDEKLENDYNNDEMLRMVSCAAASVLHSARHRPRMSQIVRALEGNISLSDLNQGIKPGHSTVYSSYGSSDYDSSQYSEDIKNIRKMGSSENPTSEFSSNPSGSNSQGQNTR